MQLRSSIDNACPHVVFRDVLGRETAAGLLDYAVARKTDFIQGTLRNRTTGRYWTDRDLRDCLYLKDLGPFRRAIESRLRDMVPGILAELNLGESDVEPREFEITAYRDGGHFGAHIDTDERLAAVRVVSCVYYFAATPRPFSGGELRLHGLPTLSAKRAGGTAPFVDVAPETDTLVAFPSWLRHEVRPVRVPSEAWADGRFTVNCWVHRASQTVAADAR